MTVAVNDGQESDRARWRLFFDDGGTELWLTDEGVSLLLSMAHNGQAPCCDDDLAIDVYRVMGWSGHRWHRWSLREFWYEQLGCTPASADYYLDKLHGMIEPLESP